MADEGTFTFLATWGSRLLPKVSDVDLAALNRLTLQDQISNFLALSVALNALIRRRAVERCVIFSGDRALGAALGVSVEGLVRETSVWNPFYFRALRWAFGAARRITARRRGPRSLATLTDQVDTAVRRTVQGHPKPSVLIVAESTPMAQTFAAVEEALTHAGVGPLLRIQFGQTAGTLVDSSAQTILPFPRPGALPGVGAWNGSRTARAAAQRILRANGGSVAVSPCPVPVPVQAWVDHLYDEVDRQATLVLTAHALVEHLQPNLVVVGNDRWWVGQAFVRAARTLGVRTLCVQDGLGLDFPGWWWCTADVVAASGPILRRILIEHGLSSERCVVTGQPRYDDLLQTGGPNTVSRAREALGLTQACYRVLFATQPGQDPGYLLTVVGAILEVDKVHLMLRPHPSERRGAHEHLLRLFGQDRISLYSTENILDLVRACDALVTQTSSVALEAALLGKPVVTVNLTGLRDLTPYSEAGLSTPVESPSALTAAVQQLSSAVDGAGPSKVTAEALEDLLGPRDGRAAARVAALVESMLSNKGEAIGPSRAP